MVIKRLKIKNFRNYEQLNLAELDPGINVLFGNNAQGKTNLLEAIYYLSCAKSFRSGSDAKLIREGCSFSLLSAEYKLASHAGQVEAALLQNGKKSIKINGMPIRKISEMLGVINAVIFAPEDLRTIKESPGLRRRLMDMEISKIRPSYYVDLQQYLIALKNKNKLLKDHSAKKELIEVYNEALIEYGSRIIQKRSQFIHMLANYAGMTHTELSGGEELKIIYRSSVDEKQISESLRKKVESVYQREREVGISLVGPHRDDLLILMNQKDAKEYASQGQQRTAMLSIKLACSEIAHWATGESPIILLDDVFSELDKTRRERLLSFVKKNQVFITAADMAGIESARGLKLFEVSEGHIFYKKSF